MFGISISDFYTEKRNQIDIYLVIFFAGASFYWIADKVNMLSLSALLVISVSGMALCTILAPYTSNAYWLYFVLSVAMPVLMVIFAMGICKLEIGNAISCREYSDIQMAAKA